MTKQKKFLTCDGNQAAAHVQRGSRDLPHHSVVYNG